MGAIAREAFVPAHERARAYADGALPIEHGQSISQPYMVALMTEALALEGPERVLEIGTGTGYQAAVLAALCEQVFSIEERPDVIFFLTDGEIPRAEETLETVTLLNSRGRRVVINTIAFGDPASQELLREIARRSGGIYRFVASDDW